MRARVTGATGFVGGRLAQALTDEDVETRCLVRDRSRARHLANAGHEVREGDVLDPGDMLGEMPVDAGVARPLVEGLSTRTVVTDPNAARLFDVAPMPSRPVLEWALAEERNSQ